MLICDCIRIQTNSKNLHFWGGGGEGGALVVGCQWTRF